MRPPFVGLIAVVVVASAAADAAALAEGEAAQVMGDEMALLAFTSRSPVWILVHILLNPSGAL